MLRHDLRYIARLKRATIAGHAHTPLRVTGTHLITGGLGGLGAQLALHLAAAGASHLMLVVKNPLPDRQSWDTLSANDPQRSRIEIVRKLEVSGAKVTVAAIDLVNESSLPDLFSTLDFTHAPLRGVWHTAMSLSSAPLSELSSETVRMMIQVKAATAWQLHELTNTHKLDHFVLFSSTTALWGAAGLSHYAAANSFLDSLAHFRRSEQLPATAINWGTWEKVSTLSTAQRDKAARAGLRPMPAAMALAALDRVLAEGTCQAVVANVDWSIFKPTYESRRHRPFLANVAVEPVLSSVPSQDKPAHALIDQLISAESDERRELLARHVQQLLTAVLGTGTNNFIDRRKGFFDSGMDSLTSVQLRRRLENDLQRPLVSTLTFNYPTVDLLTDHLISELFPAVREITPAQTMPPRSVGPAAVVDITQDIEATEDELFDQLATRLQGLRT